MPLHSLFDWSIVKLLLLLSYASPLHTVAAAAAANAADVEFHHGRLDAGKK